MDINTTPKRILIEDYTRLDSQGKEHNLVVSVKFSITEFFKGSYIQGFALF